MSSVTREGPSLIQCSTCITKQMTLHLNAFRGEPAISVFDWHFTRLPTAHPSILQHTPVRASTGSYTRFPLAMGRSHSFGSLDCDKHALFELAFALPPVRSTLSRHNRELVGSLCKRHAITGQSPALTVCRHSGFRFCFTPLPGCFSPFPHGTCSLSVAKCI